MSDQAEEIRRRLEAKASGQPLPPITPPPQQLPTPPPPIQPATAELARKRRLEAAIDDTSRAQAVVVVDVKIKFWSLVVLMVKSAFAAIPALFIVAVAWYFIIQLLSNLAHK